MRALVLLLALLLAACGPAEDDRTTLTIQRFFGACEAEYGAVTDIAAAQGECGIMTAIINRFEAENPDIRVVENIVFWPGYDQLTAQLASNDAPDLVTMHGSVISDYQARGLIEPMDADLAKIGIAPAGMTEAARAAITIDGRVWGLPIDTWAPLWHINMNLFRKAGLVRGGRPVLPSSPAELIAQAEQFEARTGKPYFVQGAANEYAGFTRNFYTFLMQQNGEPFADPRRADFTTPEAAEALRLFKDIYDRDLTTKNQDYSAAVAGFLKGDGGVFLVGTWMVGDFQAASEAEEGALSGGYAVVPYPQLYARDVTFADGHNWVMPADPDRTAAEHEAALRFLAFFSRHAFDWSRTGHLPVYKAMIDSPRWRALPHRDALAGLATSAAPLPKGVRRQFPIETIVGQESAAAISGAKPIPTALADMERRVNDILKNL
ncbi:extracellular solute-binding protein [Sphingomonas gilva]|uniref:Extracellular solute-binding protein n=1 Tax=Sphingomonas gilva TaxID=2305907 RepID=A0A396RRA9_9SPHN|nr:extracellular solute-binding protein [Sphingomonas gilva]RHW18919.1 extracellular solute-binding protein [Sphingomonas gilva]